MFAIETGAVMPGFAKRSCSNEELEPRSDAIRTDEVLAHGVRSKTGRSGGAAGFSLIEVFIALAIAAMLAAVLTRFVAGTRANAAKVTEFAEMAALGQALLARTVSSQSLQPGRTAGRRDPFVWRIDITPVFFTAQPRRMNDEPAVAPAGGAARGPGSPAKPEGSAEPAPSSAIQWATYRIAVAIQAPSGQNYAIDTIRLGPGHR